jgi:Leucine-rich repeat (LRR) protein
LTTFDELTNEIVKDWIDSLEIVENDNEIYYFDITDEVGYNFDVTADWASQSVVDKESFESQLGGGLTTSEFELIGNRLKCFIDSNPLEINLVNYNNIEVHFITIEGLESLILEDTGIIEFNPIKALPESLKSLDLMNNSITEFNPTIPLPINLEELRLDNNNIAEFNPTTLIPLNLKALELGSNQLTYFNPSVSFPASMLSFGLRNNLIDNSGWIISETWANTLSIFTDACEIDTTGNIDSAIGTDFQDIIIAKNAFIVES